jgi:hypothetical protein
MRQRASNPARPESLYFKDTPTVHGGMPALFGEAMSKSPGLDRRLVKRRR